MENLVYNQGKNIGDLLNYVVENGEVSTGEFQHRIEYIEFGSLYLSTKRLKMFLQAKRHSLEASS